MKRLASWLCIWALLAPLGCGSENDLEPPGTPAARAPAAKGDGETPGASSPTESAHGASDSSSSAPSIASAAPLPAASGSAPPVTPSTPASASGTSTTPSSAPTPSDGPSPATPAASGAAGASAGTSAATSKAAPPSSAAPSGGGNNQVQAGILTAGAWDDNRNFERFTHYREQLAQQQLAGILPSTDAEHTAAHEEFSQDQGARDTLDVSLVIDTTGSMGDEIHYLQSEFTALSNAIEAKYPNAQQRWSLVVYRDSTDEYLTRWYDFRDNADDFRDKLAQQSATGGGDFPEAPDAALAAMAQLAWRTDAKTARLAFWVADAPHHNDHAQAMLKAIRGAHDLDVHVYPVASSGVDELTELTMRTTAQLTGGRYLFLTDDSGVGNSHKEPSIPCYFVTHLDKAILRMVDIELGGKYEEPAQSDVIRSTGDPKDGSCDLESGETVSIF